MNEKKDGKATERNDAVLRQSTRNLMFSIVQDVWPNEPTCLDFGIKTQEHLEALYYPVRHGEITASQLDDALGSGPKLTELVNGASLNPHQGIHFTTLWDGISRAVAEVSQQGKEKDSGIER